MTINTKIIEATIATVIAAVFMVCMHKLKTGLPWTELFTVDYCVKLAVRSISIYYCLRDPWYEQEESVIAYVFILQIQFAVAFAVCSIVALIGKGILHLLHFV